jgi:hypothetical protein
MTRQAFDALVRRIEDRYAGRQSALERATALWVGLGLAGLLSWMLLLTGAGLLCFALGTIVEAPGGIVLIVIGVVLTLYGIHQTACILRAEVDPPAGHVVAAGEAPSLGLMLDDLRRELHCRPFDEVWITMELNAGVRELPRLGLLGWSRKVLEIGLPLARTMSPEELKAVLAHEFVHLSARHARSGARIYRLNRRWGNLFQRMQAPAGDSFTRMSRSAISRFVGWYWPRLHARSLILSRAHEFEADREAARIAGSRAMATALWRLEGRTSWLSDRFWPELFAKAAEWPEPPGDVVERLSAALRTPPAPEDAALWTERGLIRATLHDETHPALLDRVRPLGLTPDDLRGLGFPSAAEPSSAEALLGGIVPDIERDLSAKWRKDNLGPWRDRYRRAASEARRQATVSANAAPSAQPSADVHGLWEAACQAFNLRGPASAVPMLERVLVLDPEHDGASVLLGRHLATAGNPEGEVMLAGVLARDSEPWIRQACEALQEVYRASGRMDALREIHARLDRHEADLQASRLERSTVTAGDGFAPHGLTEEQLAPLRELLASMPDAGTAWLTRKQLKHFPKRPMFVLCVRGAATRWWSKDAERESELVRRLVPKVELPGQALVISGLGAFRALAKKTMRFPGSEVFRRDENSRP